VCVKGQSGIMGQICGPSPRLCHTFTHIIMLTQQLAFALFVMTRVAFLVLFPVQAVFDHHVDGGPTTILGLFLADGACNGLCLRPSLCRSPSILVQNNPHHLLSPLLHFSAQHLSINPSLQFISGFISFFFIPYIFLRLLSAVFLIRIIITIMLLFLSHSGLQSLPCSYFSLCSILISPILLSHGF